MSKKRVVGIVLAVLIIGGGGGGAYYYKESSKYIKTEDAKVAGDLRALGSLASGKLLEWRFKEGDSFHKGDVLGVVETAPASGNTPATTKEILAPDDGTMIQSSAVQSQTVGAGATLAMSADMNKLYVTANLKETEVSEVQIGNQVTLTIDAFPGTVFTGRIERIGLGTNSSFSLIQSSNASGNYTKIVQRIPVKIVLDNYQGKRLIPGLNAVVKIVK